MKPKKTKQKTKKKKKKSHPILVKYLSQTVHALRLLRLGLIEKQMQFFILESLLESKCIFLFFFFSFSSLLFLLFFFFFFFFLFMENNKQTIRFQEGSEVQLKIDEQVRRANARLHSAGHLLDSALKSLGVLDSFNLVPTKGYHFASGPNVG